MRLVNRTNIESWAQSADSKLNFPILISKLVRATTPPSTKSAFPSGTAANVGGWDGIVQSDEETAYVPKGTSLWEFGTEASPAAKAEKDYKKRTDDALGYDIASSTYIFITPRFWKDKDDWKNEKQAEGKWQNVLVYDSRDIEEWLDSAQAVSIWLSDYLKIYPFDGALIPDIYWEEWSIGPKCKLSPEFVTAGRQIEMQSLFDFLSDKPFIKAVQASTKDEAIAFIIAVAMQFETDHKELFFSKTLIIDSEKNYRGVRINSGPLNLIPRFDNPIPLFAAVERGHHVLIPLGADDTFNLDTIKLPVIDKEGQIEALIKMGIDRSQAENFTKEAGRNTTILKKFLGFPQYKAEWLDDPNIRELIPAMLLGRWNEGNKGDKKIIETLSGETYEDYVLKLDKWKIVENSPIIQIGDSWRLTSPLDIWTNLSSLLLEKDFKLLDDCFVEAFQNGNPLVPSYPDHPDPKMSINKERVFSNWSREGLLQSLILIGTYGETLKMKIGISAQIWVDNIIEKLLTDAKSDLWKSLNSEMPLIAEASPESFMSSVLSSLAQNEKPVMEMFVEEEGLISPSSNHTGLLWALEGLAWMPEYLPEASLILAKLATLDPGGKLSNRPINSLTEIFKPWHFQTLASLGERKKALENIIKSEKDVGWTLFRRLLPKFSEVGHPTHKMRWRMFNTNTNFTRYNSEVYEIHSFIGDQLIANFDFSENKFAELIDDSDSSQLNPDFRNKIMDFLSSEYNKIQQDTYVAWEELRKTLYFRKSHPNEEWTPEKLKPYEILYDKLTPSDTILKNKWLFDDQWPEVPEGFNDKTTDTRFVKRQEQLDIARLKAIKEIEGEYGLQKIVELSKEVKQSWTLGESMARIVNDSNDLKKIALNLLEDSQLNKFFVFSFFYEKVKTLGLHWAVELYQTFRKKNLDNKALALIFLPLNQGKDLWQFIETTDQETIDEYWSTVQPRFHHLELEEKIQGMEYLIKYKRYFTAIHEASFLSDDLPTDMIVTILKSAATDNETAEEIQFRAYEIGKLFEILDKREDIERSELIQLEWFYLLILDSSGTKRNTKALYTELANNPDFFVQVLKFAYVPSNKELIAKEIEGLTEETIQNRAHQAFKLLYSWKTVPGVSDDKTIDQESLNQWVNSVREYAKAADRLEIADNQIGKILAQYPENLGNWPPKEIADIIEKIHTQQIKSGFSTALFNKRGFSGRGALDGGDIERGHAQYFDELAKKHRLTHPNLSKIFSNLSKGYLRDAKQMDDEAERRRLDY